jgi:outer membrane protein OmpA-like peptidoglycan-associated protein
MKTTVAASLAIGVLFLSPIQTTRVVAQAPAARDINLTSFANGALVESTTSDYGSDWIAKWLTDENSERGWASAAGAKGPFAIVLSLPARSEVHAVEFDTASTETPARSAKDIDVAISDASATAGFTDLISVSLRSGANRQSFTLTKPGAGRWIRLTVKTNQGDPEYSELMEFRAMGRPLAAPPPMPANLSGTYSSEHYGNFHLRQEGATLTGCYEYNQGLVQGGAETNLLRLTWREDTGGSGPALMMLRRDGKSFEGWWKNGDSAWRSDWDLKKVTDTVGSCPHWNPNAAGDSVVARQLATDGRVRIYGINFDVDSDRIRADAKPAIDQLIAALKANAGWNVVVEGHTDSTGNAAHNMELSQLRAKAVKAALVAGGIADARLTTEGFGQTKPIASNDTDAGRAQNRRVEIARR